MCQKFPNLNKNSGEGGGGGGGALGSCVGVGGAIFNNGESTKQDGLLKNGSDSNGGVENEMNIGGQLVGETSSTHDIPIASANIGERNNANASPNSNLQENRTNMQDNRARISTSSPLEAEASEATDEALFLESLEEQGTFLNTRGHRCHARNRIAQQNCNILKLNEDQGFTQGNHVETAMVGGNNDGYLGSTNLSERQEGSSSSMVDNINLSASISPSELPGQLGMIGLQSRCEADFAEKGRIFPNQHANAENQHQNEPHSHSASEGKMLMHHSQHSSQQNFTQENTSHVVGCVSHNSVGPPHNGVPPSNVVGCSVLNNGCGPFLAGNGGGFVSSAQETQVAKKCSWFFVFCAWFWLFGFDFCGWFFVLV